MARATSEEGIAVDDNEIHVDIDLRRDWNQGTSDFTIVIATTAILDNDLRSVLRKKFCELSKGLEERVFEASGAPLGTLSNRSVVAYSLRLIDRETLTALDAIRKIRNEFAHQPRMTYLQKEEGNIQKYLEILGWKPDQDRFEFWAEKIHELRLKIIGADALIGTEEHSG
jgi:hypothetical protein